MRRFQPTRWAVVLTLPILAGCASNPMVLQGNLQKLEKERIALLRQNEQLQARANSLDLDNQELEQMLAQTRQQGKVLEDQLAAVRGQLTDLTAQLAKVREEKIASAKKVEAMAASMKRRGGASITPNNSLVQELPQIDLPGVHVRRDGDVLRVELPADQLFEPQTARLRPGAQRYLTEAAAALVRVYPDNIVGIEGHADNAPVQGGYWQNSHQLSVGRAMAVYDALVKQARMQPKQLFVVGHGANHPIVSNATPAGKQRNRRVELVVYPERAG